MQKKSKGLFGLVVLCVILAATGLWQVKRFAAHPLLIQQETYYTLPAGAGRVVLEQQLESQHIVPGSPWFGWLLKIEPDLAKFKAGTYRLTPGMNVRQLLLLLASGKEAQFPIRFVEGQRIEDWLKTLRDAPWITHQLSDDQLSTVAKALAMQPSELEGGFYPDTYYYTAKRTDISLLKQARTRMVQLQQKIWANRDPDLPYNDLNQLVTMASIIEKETAIPDERGKVASVFVNRLRKGMRLQTDPTVIYGLGSDYKGTLTREDLVKPTAYNTYVIPALPPGPIAIPSRASLEAAAHPEKSDLLYFVANGQGGHTFTSTLANHNQAVKAWRKVESERKTSEK
ncbi:endolytic transglycosylase MltG [Rosenbergiella australiborealis]|uniref:Endolytic murein transglycosylase n=1 Tax=Rosenbergiella australiborealis TaxID=1544696 RepID=A0ABS5T2S0_9GAMM|nr:endolytic transglycosylase MltG [Rosenbergiella australiborealis]MBT0726611.1 endolytic transglycosylase MltG [Rosenbergiella australiborealis]